MIEALTAEDGALLCAEARGTQLQIGALCFFRAAPFRDDQGRVRVAELRSHAASRLGALPRFRQRIAPVLGNVAAPMWVDDTDFAIERHCKLVRLPGAGGPEALRSFMDRLLGEPMDFAHPLWDIHLVEGVDGGTTSGVGADERIAVVFRAHHVMADGIAVHAAATLLLDPVPRPARTVAPHGWSPDPTPGPLGLTARALVERTRRQIDLAAGITRTLADPRRLAANTRLATRVVGAIGHGPPPTAPRLPFTGPVGSRRAFAWDTIPMADVVAVKEACGATVNDVVLAIVTGALRRHTEAGSADPAGGEPRALIPIGDPASDPSTLGNRFSIRSVGLPVGVDEPLERVRLLHSRMHADAPSVVRSFMPHLFSIADLVPPPVLRGLVPPLLAHQPLVNLAVSNIPGSREPLYLWESPMLGLHPFINVVGNVALIIGVLSYIDGLGVGITVDPDVVGGPDTLVPHLRDAMAELVTLVR